MNKNEPYTLEKECAASELQLQAIKGKAVTLVFDEPELTSDAGLLAVGPFEKRTMGRIERLAGCVREDRRDPKHTMAQRLGQRVHQIISGNPDGNDSDRLRGDAALQTAVGCEEELASQPTMSRVDNEIAAAHRQTHP